jgi:hypothetical protein
METFQYRSDDRLDSDYLETLRLRPDDHDYIETLHLRPDGTIDCDYYVERCHRRIAESEALQRKWQQPEPWRATGTSGWRTTGLAAFVLVSGAIFLVI